MERFARDGLISLDDCKKLMFIASNFMSNNDGYKETVGLTSPHTKNELFQGITLSRVGFLVYIGLLRPSYLQLMLRVTEQMRRAVIEKFTLEKHLYFSYTHLVCRSALKQPVGNRTHFSHKIHADNCNLMGEDNCKKEFPAFFWRDYSAILYLNDDFKGGKFMFSADTKGELIQSYVTPKCGRMVGFSSGKENLHGVTAVQSGRRCALAVWFTNDPKYQEFDRDVSYHILDNDVSFYQFPTQDVSELV